MSNRGRNPIYNSLSSKIYRCKLLSEKLKLIRLRDHYQRNMGSDKSFKRAYFVRYADDIIIGVMGSHNDCKNILNDINNFLKENLGMSINIDKSVIKHSKEGVSFLGYDKVILKFGKVLVDPHSKVSFSIDDFKIRHKINITDSNYTPDEILDRYKYMLPRSLSLFSGICQICGSKHDLEVHHVRTLNNAANKIKDDYLLGRMIKINRKQITICKTCHFKVHQGKYNGPGL
ncbi:putative nicotine oxidoreductase [Saccharomyces cerevisiae]|nr:putative nicotine oxidoreductase [Saccharomyces cerevisiae]